MWNWIWGISVWRDGGQELLWEQNGHRSWGKPRTNFKVCNASEGEADTIGLIRKSFVNFVSTVRVVYHNMKWRYDHQCKQLRVCKATSNKLSTTIIWDWHRRPISPSSFIFASFIPNWHCYNFEICHVFALPPKSFGFRTFPRPCSDLSEAMAVSYYPYLVHCNVLVCYHNVNLQQTTECHNLSNFTSIYDWHENKNYYYWP